MLIRAEEQNDWAAVHAVNTSAFETPVEANLVDTLRKQAHPIVSLVAADDKTVVGLGGHPKAANEGHLKTGQ